VVETVRGLLPGSPLGDHACLAIAWSVGILIVSITLADMLFRRRIR
jgi:ABC-2 type transport system permease protein